MQAHAERCSARRSRAGWYSYRPGRGDRPRGSEPAELSDHGARTIDPSLTPEDELDAYRVAKRIPTASNVVTEAALTHLPAGSHDRHDSSGSRTPRPRSVTARYGSAAVPKDRPRLGGDDRRAPRGPERASRSVRSAVPAVAGRRATYVLVRTEGGGSAHRAVPPASPSGSSLTIRTRSTSAVRPSVARRNTPAPELHPAFGGGDVPIRCRRYGRGLGHHRGLFRVRGWIRWTLILPTSR